MAIAERDEDEVDANGMTPAYVEEGSMYCDYDGLENAMNNKMNDLENSFAGRPSRVQHG